MANVEKRLYDLEKKTNDQEGDQVKVVVDWDPDPKPPKDDDIIVEWGDDDDN